MTMLAETCRGVALEYTEHALANMLDRDVSLDDIALVLADPEQTYSGDHDGSGRTRTQFQRGDLTVVTDLDSRKIITVLYRIQERWTGAQGRPNQTTMTPVQRDAVWRMYKAECKRKRQRRRRTSLRYLMLNTMGEETA